MPRKAKELTDLAVRRIREPGVHFVGGVAGLALQVESADSRSWILRVMIGGRRRDMGLGGYPDVPLGVAREAARLARQDIASGVDPIDKRKAAKSALKAGAAKVLTFKEAADRYVTAHEPSWRNPKHAAQWAATLKAYAYPVIGALDVNDIEVAHVLQVIEPIWTTKTETASRVRGRIEAVLDWAKVRGHRSGENPARWKGHLDHLLPGRNSVGRPEHHAALAVADVGAFMQRLREAEGQGARALEFAILCASRSGEVRGATWDEVDLKAKVWTIPGDRMKAGKPHRVPLSTTAVELLEQLPRMGGTDLVFPAPRGGQLSDMTLMAVLRRMEVPATVHGFRSTFRDWVSERTTYPNEVAEMALAHTVGDKVEAAYRRGDLFERRRTLMQAWCGFVAKPDAPAKGKLILMRERA
jgi:integrase